MVDVVDKVLPAKRTRIPIVIPNAENLTEEELKKAKHAEAMRRSYHKKGKGELVAKETKQGLREISTKEMVDMSKETRNIAIQTLRKKLNELYDNPEELAKINLAQLATVFGILFDKAQLAEGLATEHIAIHAKLDINMTSDKAMQELNKMRESYAEQR